jgi:hypothetical protein
MTYTPERSLVEVTAQELIDEMSRSDSAMFRLMMANFMHYYEITIEKKIRETQEMRPVPALEAEPFAS